MFCLHVSVHHRLCTRCPQRSEEGIDPMELELQMAERHRWVQEQTVLLTGLIFRVSV